jgi:signal transduction histidine kinase
MTAIPSETSALRTAPEPVQPPAIERHPRPHPNLLIYYVLSSLMLGPFFFVLLVPRFFRYHTLRYDFDDDGVSMRWGILFRREISLTYARIQDIHLSSNLVERWLGLARIQIQTASGSAGAEMTIEGLRQFGPVRDFLYWRMRGVTDRRETVPAASTAADISGATLDAATLEDLTTALRAVAHELRSVRAALETGSGVRSDTSESRSAAAEASRE